MKAGAAVALLSVSAWGQTLTPGQGPVPTDSDTAGAIAGRVCRDVNGDGECSDDEPGIAGARIVLETGQQVFTDAQGRYHLAAVDARSPSDVRGLLLNSGPPNLSGHMTPGRHRVRLDVSRLPPTSAVAVPAVTVEVPMSGLVLQNFAVAEKMVSSAPLSAAPETLPPSGRLKGPHAVAFTVTGMAGANDQVRVGDKEGTVSAQGEFRVEGVPLKPGRNDLIVTATSPEGAIRIYQQRVDVVERDGSTLVVPRALMRLGSAQVPSAEGHPAATGASSVTLEAPPGTRVHAPSGDVVVGDTGKATIPVLLDSGRNVVPVTIEPPGGPPQSAEIAVDAAWQPFIVGLLDIEGSWTPGSGGGALWGRGGLHAEVPLGAWRLTGELELRDEDLADVKAAGLMALAGLHEPDRLDRALSPIRYPTEWGDDSVGVVPNPGEARLRLDVSNDRWGQLGLGTRRAEFADGEIGRYQRDLFGPFLDLHTPQGNVQVGVKAFGAPEWVDPVIGFATAPAHEEFWATGGSIYYLGHPYLVQGSEVVRVEIRDGLSGVPLAERHLVRGRDYEVNDEVGRIILAKPLSFIVGSTVLGSEPLTSSPQQVLIVEYEHQQANVPNGPLGGGEVSAKLGPVDLSAGGVDEGGVSPYRLYRARGSANLGPLTLSAEYAHSAGLAIQPGDFGVSDDGGLSFVNPQTPTSTTGGYAWGVRLKGPGWGEGGFIDASYRARSAEYSDAYHQDGMSFQEASLRAQQQFGHIVVGLIGDDLSGPDPRNPFSTASVAWRTVGGSVGYRGASWELRVEGRNSELTAAPDPYDAPALQATGGHTGVGLFGRYRVTPWLALTASHDQVIEQHGSGPGAYNNTFSSVGAEVSPSQDTTVGVRGGWGPTLGPQVWANAQTHDGPETHYGTYSVDVDGPDVGQQKMVSGARTEVGDHSAVFVEDVGAHDATTVRLSRAIGVTEELAEGFEVSGRYERGVAELLDLVSPLTRDTAGGSASFVRKRLRLFARGEYRFERGTTFLGGAAQVHRIQWLASGGATLHLLDSLSASGMINASQTTNFGALEARFIDANAGLTWRSGPWMAVLHYGLMRNLAPPGSTAALLGEYVLQLVSLQPAVHLGSRLMISAGANAGWLSEAGTTLPILSASVRPSVRVWQGLELALEGARRTSAPDGGQLGSVRAEVGYRMKEQFLLAIGFTALGYSGLGMTPCPENSTGTNAVCTPDRVYLRGEMAY